MNGSIEMLFSTQSVHNDDSIWIVSPSGPPVVSVDILSANVTGISRCTYPCSSGEVFNIILVRESDSAQA